MDLEEQLEKFTELESEDESEESESPAGRALQQTSSSSVGLDSVYIAMVSFACFSL